jgi:hypothetical protein
MLLSDASRGECLLFDSDVIALAAPLTTLLNELARPRFFSVRDGPVLLAPSLPSRRTMAPSLELIIFERCRREMVGARCVAKWRATWQVFIIARTNIRQVCACFCHFTFLHRRRE